MQPQVLSLVDKCFEITTQHFSSELVKMITNALTLWHWPVPFVTANCELREREREREKERKKERDQKQIAVISEFCVTSVFFKSSSSFFVCLVAKTNVMKESESCWREGEGSGRQCHATSSSQSGGQMF
mmetsp:Transcript_31779/g.62063  ORF Transcript_31779/g.62063 Transcript_31779/m.62063 type:complete len:129 (+) Transcript_31779:102-488(+)